MAVAVCAALALLAQPILTAAWTSDAVRFIARAAQLQERAMSLSHQVPATAATREWLDETRLLLDALPFRIELPVAPPPATFDSIATAMPVLEAGTLAVAEALQRHLRVDIAVRIALLLVAAGGASIGLHLRRNAEQFARESAAHMLAAAPPPDRWLDLLDRVIAELAGPALGRQALKKLSEGLGEALDASACGICLSEDIQESMQLPPVIHAGELGWAQVEQLRLLSVAGRYQTFELGSSSGRDNEVSRGIAVPVGDGSTWYGHLFAVGPEWGEHPTIRVQVIELVSKHVAMAIGHSRRTREGRRLALIEERTSMARELHDSLAQSLSFMKIQVSRVQTLLQRGRPSEEVAAAAEELRDGLNGAYRKLRELLNTFRTQINAGGLAAALDEALEEYGERSSVAMTLDNRLGNYHLSANEEFHVVQIVREALSNVVRHAGASHAIVKLALREDGWTAVTIEDDGGGFEPAADHWNHHGATIMRERALSLGGALSIERRPQGGCRVTASFKSTAGEE
ncbi:histidine kinase [Aromatoleum sp.]|uniref:histidine kinase n=1 Tax=Aromatoleum sp. TaxID=2307007 RepID=UPI002FC933D1